MIWDAIRSLFSGTSPPPPRHAVPSPPQPPPPEPPPPHDDMPPPSNVGAEAPPSLAMLLDVFETLGCTPELGLARREFGAAPDGLLGFAALSPEILATLLRTRFDGVGAAENLAVSDAFGLYYVADRRHPLNWQTSLAVDTMSASAALDHEAGRLTALRERLVDNLSSGRHLFVLAAAASPTQIDDIRAAMQAYGGNTLLHLALADDDHPPGHVEWQAPGLLIGRLSRYGNGPRGWDIAFEDWAQVCEAAHRHWRQ